MFCLCLFCCRNFVVIVLVVATVVASAVACVVASAVAVAVDVAALTVDVLASDVAVAATACFDNFSVMTAGHWLMFCCR